MASRGGALTSLMGGDPIRKRSGKLLVKFRPVWVRAESILGNEERDRWRAAFNRLEQLRFGPLEGRPNHRKVFREVRQLIRKEPNGNS